MNPNLIITNEVCNKRRWVSVTVAMGIALLLAFSAPAAFAREKGGPGGFEGAAGGYAGPGPALVTVEQAKKMSDDAPVALRGHIIQSLGGKDYVFKDDTGTINVEIGKKRWQGQNIGPNDLVEIHGEVDREWSKIEIDVKRISKQ